MIGGQLQKAIYAALSAAPPLCEGRIFDLPPAGDAFPRITIGDDQVLYDGNSCGDGWEIYSDVHVWSRPKAGSKLEAKDIRADVVARLTGSLTVSGFTVVSSVLDQARTMRDPDGLTEHAVLTFRHVLEPA